MKTWRVAVPRTRDPFVNTPLLSIGPGADGVELFWISSWNSNVGCTALLVRADGEAVVYHFPLPHAGFYSAVADGNDGIWLCGDLSRIVHLRLSDGHWDSYDTGAAEGLVFQGMARYGDQLMVAAFTGTRTDAVCFDTATRRTAKLYEDITPQHYLRSSFPGPDGTVTIAIETPATELLTWNPADGTLTPGPPAPDSIDRQWRLLQNAGWAARIEEVPSEVEDVRWFGMAGEMVWGARCRDSAEVVLFDRQARTARVVCSVPDSDHFNLALTTDLKVLAVTRYGRLLRYDANTGAVELDVELPAESTGRVDCVVRLDRRTVLGTPFISQRFWTVDLESGDGRDQGRAAPGGGQISRSWLVDGRAYLAAYAGGELTCFDPALPIGYPKNPRVVAAPPRAMRPVAGAVDGRVLVYSCTQKYGVLGCILTRYDLATGAVSYADDPLPEQAVQSMLWPTGSDRILVGTARHADMTSTVPAATTCYLGWLDPGDLTLQDLIPMPPGTDRVDILGLLDDTTALCVLPGPRWFKLPLLTSSTSERRSRAGTGSLEFMELPVKLDPWALHSADVPGRFVALVGDQIELWELYGTSSAARRLKVLHREPGAYRIVVQGTDVYVLTSTELVVLDAILSQ
ncbi:hypothetical protein GCM10009804_17090 [Kribbella hippodromi]|uniref:Uncharacterized protein n=1 Tax=Kribbella hippodromi TaxID=434347 RepID=A0ABP4NF43_9ACTN